MDVQVLRDCTIRARDDLPPMQSAQYRAFCDPSGGSADSFTLAIGHKDRSGVFIVDCLRERPAPFNPDEVCAEFAALCKAYRVPKLIGDRYAGEWAVERFRVHGIRYEAAAKPKSELYAALLPLLNGRRIELPDNPRMIAQLVGLERYPSRGGRDSIDHRRGAHDDLANAVAGLGFSLAQRSSLFEMVSGDIITQVQDGEVIFCDLKGNEMARCDPKDARQLRDLLDHTMRGGR